MVVWLPSRDLLNMCLTVYCLFHTPGKMIHAMVAHLDAVTCLAIDPSGLYILSGSKYFFIDNLSCVTMLEIVDVNTYLSNIVVSPLKMGLPT